MLYTFLYPYVTEASFLNVLRYPSFRIVMAALTALILTLFLFPAFIRRLQVFKFGQEVRKEGPESHYKKKGITHAVHNTARRRASHTRYTALRERAPRSRSTHTKTASTASFWSRWMP